jgi:nicotinate-nucleotide adenylyltransferase
MLRLATRELPWAVVDDFELHQPEPSYSFETAEAMARRFPQDRLFWIMGGDQWTALPRWKYPERLAACVDFIVLARGDQPQPREGWRMHPVAGGHPASATAIRDAMRCDEGDSPWLAREVAAWIRRHGLYTR